MMLNTQIILVASAKGIFHQILATEAVFSAVIHGRQVALDSNYVSLHHHDTPIASAMAESYFIIIDRLPGASGEVVYEDAPASDVHNWI